MAESIVSDWLHDFQRIQGQSAEVTTFATEHEADQEIAEAIYTIFNEKPRNDTLIHEICQQLLDFYRSKENKLRRFPLQFIPVLIYTYLHAVASFDKKSARSVETLLICIYNAEVSTEEGGERIVAFRMPILAQTSVYHEEKSLPITDLRRWEENCNREVKWGPHAQIEAISAQNRLKIMTALLFCYNHHLCQTQKSALIHLCRVTSQLVSQGFTKQSNTHAAHRISFGSDPTLLPKPTSPRIPVSSALLVELVHAIYFAMFNGFGTVAIQTLEDIHQRACYELYTELILVTSAVRNSLQANPSGQPSDGPMGLSVALTPATNTVTTAVSKSMITNASFRTKKLPDDIPIQIQDLTLQQMPPPLPVVTEEVEQVISKESTKNSIIRPSMEGIKAQAHKALIAGFKKTKGDKSEKSDKESGSKSANNPLPNEPPKPPQRKFDKHTQRNSLLKLQTEGDAAIMADAYDKSPALTNLKVKNFDMPDVMEMMPIKTIMSNENGSSTYNMDDGNGIIANNGSTTNTNSITSGHNDLLTKNFDASIEMPALGLAGKISNDISQD